MYFITMHPYYNTGLGANERVTTLYFTICSHVFCHLINITDYAWFTWHLADVNVITGKSGGDIMTTMMNSGCCHGDGFILIYHKHLPITGELYTVSPRLLPPSHPNSFSSIWLFYPFIAHISELWMDVITTWHILISCFSLVDILFKLDHWKSPIRTQYQQGIQGIWVREFKSYLRQHSVQWLEFLWIFHFHHNLCKIWNCHGKWLPKWKGCKLNALTPLAYEAGIKPWMFRGMNPQNKM